MTNTEPDPRDDDGLTRTEQKIRTLVAIRSYLRDRVDELTARNQMADALAIAKEVNWLNAQIRQAEAAQ